VTFNIGREVVIHRCRGGLVKHTAVDPNVSFQCLYVQYSCY